MENTIGRNRSVRSEYYNRRQRNAKVEKSSLITKMLKQLIICAAIFVTFLTIKNIDSVPTNYISSKVSSYIKADVEINSIIDKVKESFSSLNITNDKLKSVFSTQVINSKIDNISLPIDINDKVYDWNLLKDKMLLAPVNGTVNSIFGARINPITKENEFHPGLDINAKEGDDIRAIMDGEIIDAKNNSSLGNYIKVMHGNDLVSLYAHASSLLVNEGQQVKRGDIIAKVGSTGMSDGPHLHFELWKGDKMVDPQNLFGLTNTKSVDEK